MPATQPNERDERFMARAIELARRATGRTRPNPLVGCVIVRDGEIVGRGFHARAGDAHGEVAAIEDADGDLEGCELFVNHEPCCHYGRTPPCTDAILDTGIERVVVGTIDPDPRVRGKGIETLRAAGIEVVCGVLEEESRRLNAPFFKYIRHRLPWVAAKWAMSLDGKIATHAGDSRWITGETARRRVHRLRDHHDAILVGTGTLLADDPRLTCRLDDGRDPVRFVVDAALQAPADHRVFQHDSDAPTVVLASEEADHSRRDRFAGADVDVVTVAADDNGWLNPRGILEAISERELLSVLVEGGGTLLGSLFDAELVDYVYGFVAPRLIGGADAPTPFDGHGIDSMNMSRRLTDPVVEQLGDDVLIHGPVGELPTAPDPEEV